MLSNGHTYLGRYMVHVMQHTAHNDDDAYDDNDDSVVVDDDNDSDDAYK